VPALQTSKVDLAAEIKAESVVSGRGRGWIRSGLVLVQVSLSFVLLVGAGLLLKSLQGVRRTDPGFSTNGVLLTAINLSAAGYDTARARVFQDALLERLRSVGPIVSAAYARIPPFSLRSYSSGPIAVDGYEVPPGQPLTGLFDEIGPGYLATIGIPLVSGREFTQDDDTARTPVVVVNEAMVARYWHGADPVGKRLQVSGRWMQVVGVARDAKYSSLQEIPQPFFYVALRQHFSGYIVLHLRTSASAASLTPLLVREMHALDPELSPSELISMQQQVDWTTSPQRAAVALLEVFAAIALLLAAIGLYGVLSYVVAQTTRELGLRMALGAGAARLVRLVVARGLVLTAAGVAVGATVALGGTRLLGDLLYQVSPRDPAVFGSAFLMMGIAAAAACLVPAWRATRIDPVRALRLE
jgi:predicted permease